MTLPEIIAEARRLQRKPEPRPDFTILVVTHANDLLHAAEKSIQLRAEIEAIREAVGQKGCATSLILFIKSKISRANTLAKAARDMKYDVAEGKHLGAALENLDVALDDYEEMR